MATRIHRGFTLIELMMAVAVIAILVAIAYPNYIEYTRRARRADATGSLMQTAQQMERCLTVFNTFANPPCQVLNTVPSSDGHYSIAVTARTATTYTLTATPVAGGAQASDTKCTSFGLNQLQQRSANGSTASAEITKCWR